MRSSERSDDLAIKALARPHSHKKALGYRADLSPEVQDNREDDRRKSWTIMNQCCSDLAGAPYSYQPEYCPTLAHVSKPMLSYLA